MRIGITIDENKGMDSLVSMHFGQCQYFMIIDMDGNQVKNVKVVANTVRHGGGGCVAVDEMLKNNITHVIAGGMGMGAQEKFSTAGVKIFGYLGTVREAVEGLLENKLNGLGACKEHGAQH
ncbi:NifB/NifX family molybdenum-iron cluster-binding protein [Candidatus Omnitrophota bacterium]